MKKLIALLTAVLMITALAACGGGSEEPAEWSREGYFTDDNNNFISIAVSDEEDYPGWYVGTMIDGVSYGWYLEQDGASLHGTLPGTDSGDITVTVSEEGEDGVMMEVEGGETYHFTPSDEIDMDAAE